MPNISKAINKDRLVKTTQELIRIPSITGNEGTLAQYIINDLENYGFSTKQDEVGNVIVEFGTGKKSLILNAHMDTVPPEGYTTDPYSGIVKGGKIYGLGASDCKTGLASILEIAKTIPQPSGKLILTFNVAEEGALRGEKYQKGCMYIAKRYKADACIVLEPTMYGDTVKISAGCRGRTVVELNVEGKSTHSSRPETGLNPIDEALKVMNSLKSQTLNSQQYFSTVLHETLSVVSINAGAGANNIIPSSCKMVIDYRTLPNIKDAQKTVRRLIDATKVKTKFNSLFSSPGYVLPEDSEVLKTLSSHVERSFNRQPEVSVALGRADASYFYENGTPAIIYGPGENMQCHKPNEYANVSSLIKCTESILNFTHEFLS